MPTHFHFYQYRKPHSMGKIACSFRMAECGTQISMEEFRTHDTGGASVKFKRNFDILSIESERPELQLELLRRQLELIQMLHLFIVRREIIVHWHFIQATELASTFLRNCTQKSLHKLHGCCRWLNSRPIVCYSTWCSDKMNKPHPVHHNYIGYSCCLY
jgi:hypothetical protein